MKDVISIAENRDCVEAMKEFPDGFFDLAIVDPPYGIGDFRGYEIDADYFRDQEKRFRQHTSQLTLI